MASTLSFIVLLLSVAFPCHQAFFFKKFIDTSKTVSGSVPFEVLLEQPPVYEGIVPITNLGMWDTVDTVRNMPFPAPPRITHLVLRPTYPAPAYPPAYPAAPALPMQYEVSPAPYASAPAMQYEAPPTPYVPATPTQYEAPPSPYAPPPAPYAGGLDADDLMS